MACAAPTLQRSTSELTLPDGRPAWRALLDPVVASPRRSVPSLPHGLFDPEPRHPPAQAEATPWKTLETVLASLREERVIVNCAMPPRTISTSSGSSTSHSKAYYLNRLQKAIGIDDASSSPQPAVTVVPLESFQGSELPGSAQPFSPQEKVESWIRTASFDADQDVIEPVAASEPDPMDAPRLQDANEQLDAGGGVTAAREQAVLAHVVQRLENLERALDEERESKRALAAKYERLLQERSASHQRDVSALEEMLQSLQSENRKLARQLAHRKGQSATTPFASLSLV